jgi:hypothetical protein
MSALNRSVALLVLLMLSSTAAPAQTRDPRASAATGSISGIVVSAGVEATPVRKARVTCTGPDTPGRTTITDERGRFSFVGLPVGRYIVTASKPTWVTTAYGAARPMRAGTPVPLAAGETRRLALRLTRGAVITGIVTDFDNQPAAAADVRALRYEMVQGERRLVDAGSATTDDRGAYRIFGLAAGDYLVAASTRSFGGTTDGELHLTSDADVRDPSAAAPTTATSSPAVALAPVFYTDGSSAAQANAISLGPGEERAGIDIRLQLVRTARVEGTVMLPNGGVPDFTEVNLIAQGSNRSLPAAENLRRSHPGSDGSFLFSGVPPGTYELVARGTKPMTNADGSPAPAQMVWASMQFAVDGEPVTGLSLSLEPGLTIAGRVQFKASSLRRPALSAIRLSLLPDGGDSSISFAPPAVTAHDDGTFRIAGVVPGRYRMRASFPGSGRPGGWLVDSIVANGGDTLDAPMTVAPNQHVLDAVVTFTDRLGEITGSVHAEAGAPGDYTVVLFPEAQDLWLPQSRRIQATRAGSDGAYAFRGVPAGTYRIGVTPDAENGEWFDPAFLQRLAAGAVRVVIADGENKVQDIRAGR